ncbi:MAG: tetratricopeptide repeat protein [Deferrisomatales bacterium]|nr:tetratricopeptide repeat protein [Deferrisomatales bacterium]
MRIVLLLFAVLVGAGGAFAQVSPDALQRKEAGNHFLKQRQYEQARDQYLAALHLEPGYADAHYNLGVIYFFRIQNYPRALYHFVEYARLRPDAEDLHQVRALSIQALERVEAADRVAYAAALEDGTAAALQAYLADHPGSAFGEEALARLRELQPR